MSMDNVIMCKANSCPMADKCYRHTQWNPDNPYQSYANLEYECHEEMKTKYEYLIPLQIERKIK